jgi:hypothetical protein
VKLEIEDKELIELLVTLKERLAKIEKKIDSLCAEVDEAEQCIQSNPYGQFVSYNTSATPSECNDDIGQPLNMSEDLILRGAMPTPESLGLYGCIPVIDPKDWEVFLY